MSPLPASCALAFVPCCRLVLILIVRCGRLGVTGPGGHRFSIHFLSTQSSVVGGW